MMKKLVLFAVLTVLAAYGSCTEVEPAELQYSKGFEAKSESNDEGPVQVIESFEEVNLDNDFLGLVRSNSLLLRGTYRRAAVANAILVHRVTYTGRASTRISSVRGVQIGANQGARAVVTSGGVGSNRVTVEIRSQRGRGYHMQVDIVGRA